MENLNLTKLKMGNWVKKSPKKLTVMVIATAIAAMTILKSCKQEEKRSLNVVDDIEAVHRWPADKQAVLDELKNIPVENRQAYLKANWPSLSADLILFLREIEKIGINTKIDSIVYKFGSAEGVKAEDKSGKIHEGMFKNELLAYLYSDGKEKPHMVIVACTNGTFYLPKDVLDRVGKDTNFEFTIEKGKGIAYYTGDNETAISLAESFNLPLYLGKGVHGKKLTPAQARDINTDEIQITVQVYAGDHFDLNDMELVRANGETVRAEDN